ncbi:MAG TPA: hypothetical protein VIG51_12815 [Candidatus Baltobacteraceae bacterium]|jgi:hypothetical protein
MKTAALLLLAALVCAGTTASAASNGLELQTKAGSWRAVVTRSGGFGGIYRRYELTSGGLARTSAAPTVSHLADSRLLAVAKAATVLALERWRLMPVQCCDRITIRLQFERVGTDGSVQLGTAQWTEDTSANEAPDAVGLARAVIDAWRP